MINTEDDLLSLLRLCKSFHDETTQGREELDYLKLKKIFALAYQFPDKFYLDFKKDKDGEFVGMFVGYTQELFYSTYLEALELFYYVREDHRGSPWFIKTLKRFETWAKEKGATSIRLLPSSGVKSNSSVGMYERLGYDVIGHVLHKEI